MTLSNVKPVMTERDRGRVWALSCAVLIAAAAALLGCIGPRVVVLPSGVGVATQGKSPSCEIEFYRTKVDRSYDEIAALHASGGDTFRNGPDDFREALRSKACELGADAVVVTQDYSGRGGAMNAVAIKYREAAAERR